MIASRPEIDIAHIARLARLELRDDETARIASDLARILDYVAELQSLDLRDIPPMSHPLPFPAALREDIAAPAMERAVALSGAPVKDPAHAAFIVPKVV
jgi:aspartyl-tRNA(Asn)/glutamyl-tRNA(Gln) amidotransferase subunit C